MRLNKTRIEILSLIIFLMRAVIGLAAPADSEEKMPPGAGDSLAIELTMLRKQLEAQQVQIEQLERTLEKQKQLLRRLLQSAQAAQSQSPPALASTSSTLTAPGASRDCDSGVFQTDGAAEDLVKVNATHPAQYSAPSGLASQQDKTTAGADVKKSPLTLRIGEADFTIGGFVDATAFFRSTNVGSGIGTSFGAIPFSNSPLGRLSETRLTAQNSRVSLLATSKVGKTDVKGYIESDFLGVQPANGFVTSNSHSMRMRLFWVQLRRGKFEFLGGQSWSMMNPNRSGLSPVPADIFFSQDMDTNYQVGLTWSRNNQFRFIYHPSERWAAGISLENPQQFTGLGVVLPSSFDARQVDIGANVAAPNLHPDIIAKVAHDAMVSGRRMHVEAAGLLRSFRIFNSATNSTSTATGGGMSVNLDLEVVKNFRLVLTTFYSDGGGRYIFGLGPDFIVKADGNLSLVRSGSGIAGFEYQFDPQTMVYGYYGGAYYWRNFSIEPVAKRFVGFGFPGSPASANKSIQEATFGIIQTFWKNPSYGALQLITQYSYVTRSPWWAATGDPTNAHSNMGYINVRYVLP
ncbi:MAG TPA: hypothetical protein VGQ81_04895 [Acidobacteriota bacterium]|jgi:hypothetical protein|nr:hypothetical protein [Acidobacteriota bacterium]